jgi:hypothetical protein
VRERRILTTDRSEGTSPVGNHIGGNCVEPATGGQAFSAEQAYQRSRPLQDLRQRELSQRAEEEVGSRERQSPVRLFGTTT